MKKFLILSAAVATFAITSCKKEAAPSGESNTPESFNPVNTKAADYVESTLPKDTISGNISVNTTLTKDKVWYLKGIVAVDNATITIEAGTHIVGLVDANNKPGVLAICRHGQINAVGTASAPIVFTSKNLVDGNTFTTAAPGDFGGVILLGQAPVNVANKTIEGLDAIEPFDNRYGGAVSNHSSGTMKYVRIEYAGYILSAGNEVNGLTCGGVGSGTTLDHIEVAYGADDSFEFFGGTVNATYLISLAPDDDNFDFDNGYRGTIQYALAVADVFATHSTSGSSSDSNGIESDNNAPAEDATYSLTPKTHPILRNLTIIGAPSINTWAGLGYKYGARIRRGSEIEIYESVILGYPTAFNFDDNTQNFYTSAVSKVQKNMISGLTNSVAVAGAANASLATSFTSDGNINFTNATLANFSTKITQPFLNNTKTQVNFVPVGTSPAFLGSGHINPTNGTSAFNKLSRPNFGNQTWAKWYF